MKLFNATHILKATGNTLLLVYSTCLGQNIFTIGLPGKCGHCTVTAAGILLVLLVAGAEESLGWDELTGP